MFLVESREKDTYTELHVFSRDENGKKSVEIVKDFKPYFYVDESEEVPKDARITYTETGYNSITGTKVRKVFVKNAKFIKDTKELFVKHYEADIPFTQRYIVDEIGEIDIYPLKTLFLDIETDSHDLFPNLKEPDQAVISCSFVDNFSEKSYALLLITDEHKENIPPESDIIKHVHSEEELLNGILRYVQDVDPDIISGWNVDGFDLTYLIRRMKMLDVDYNKFSPMNWVYISEYKDEVVMKGRIILDLMAGYAHFRRISNQGKAESYSLEFTAQSVLGMGKIEHKESFHEMWMQHPDKLIEYNIRDTVLCKDIDKELEIISFFDSIRAKACSQIKSIYQTTSLVDGLFLRRSHDKVVLPSKNQKGGEKYDGAYVFEPTPGIFEYVLALDLKSMYPNIIKTFNMSYETFNPDGAIKINKDIGFNDGIGLISGCLRDLQGERDGYKKDMKTSKNKRDWKIANFRQYAVKVLMNSQYGYLGYPGSRLYKREVAFAITYIGQELIKWTAELLRDKGYKIVYGDTDSVYVQGTQKTKPGLMIEGNKLVKLLNESYKEFAEKYGATDCSLEIEFEKMFERIMFVEKKSGKGGAKKRYAYIAMWVDGKDVEHRAVEYTGFDTVRSDSPRISREAQKHIIERVLKGAEKEEIVDYLKDLDNKIRTRVFSDEEFGFPKGISEHLTDYKQANPIVTGALYANKYLGKRYTKGSKPKFVYIKGVPKGFPKTHVIAFDEEIPEGFIPDFDTIIDKIFKMKLESIFKAAGFGEFPILHNKNENLSRWGI